MRVYIYSEFFSKHDNYRTPRRRRKIVFGRGRCQLWKNQPGRQAHDRSCCTEETQYSPSRKERLLHVIQQLEKTGKRDSWLYHVARALPETVILKFKNSWFPVSPVVSALEKWRSGTRIAFSYFIRPPEHPRDIRRYLRVAAIRRKLDAQ